MTPDQSALINALKQSALPSRLLDVQVAFATGWEREGAHGESWRWAVQHYGHQRASGAANGWSVPYYTTSLDAALTLMDPAHYWICGAGKTRPDEPLYGAQVMLNGVVIGEGEHPTTAALALVIATLSARWK